MEAGVMMGFGAWLTHYLAGIEDPILVVGGARIFPDTR